LPKAFKPQNKSKSKKSKATPKKSSKSAPKKKTPAQKEKLLNIDAQNLITRETMFAAEGLKGLLQYVDSQNAQKYKATKFKKIFISQAYQHCRSGLRISQLARKFMVHSNTIGRWAVQYREFYDAIKRGTAEFYLSLPDKLVEHLNQGKSYTAFAAVANRAKDFLYQLEIDCPGFKEAKEVGSPGAQLHWENIAHAQATGTLSRVSKEIVLYDEKGDPMKDPVTGEIVKDRTYVPAFGSDRALVFIMQNRFDDYRPENTGEESDLFRELREVMDAAQKEEMKHRGVTKVIDVTKK